MQKHSHIEMGLQKSKCKLNPQPPSRMKKVQHYYSTYSPHRPSLLFTYPIISPNNAKEIEWELPKHRQEDHDNQLKGQIHSSDHCDEPGKNNFKIILVKL